MSCFTTPLIVELLSNRRFKIMKEFFFYVGHKANDEIITVPVGFITDLASIPRIFWTILPPNGKYAKAAVIHDYLYANKIKTKEYADNIFLEAMEVLGVEETKRYIIYYAVKAFGKGAYEPDNNEESDPFEDDEGDD